MMPRSPMTTRIEIDLTLLSEADKLKTGADVHELNRLTGMYKSAAERHDPASFAIHGDALRKLVTVIKRRAHAAPTCKHENMQRVKALGWTWLFCDECGHTADERKTGDLKT
jgi:hypothetical protein